MSYAIWIILGLLLLGCELIIPSGQFLLFLGGASIVVGSLTYLGLLSGLNSQFFLFSIFALLLLVVFWKRLFRGYGGSHSETDVDSIVGQSAIAMADISPGESGRVELRGANWSAHNVGSMKINTGELVKISSVDGIILHITKQ